MRAGEDADADPHVLYQKRWLPFEGDAWSQYDRRGRLNKSRLEWMVHSMLEAVTGQEVDHQRLYNDYKDFVRRSGDPRTAEEQLTLMETVGELYTALVTGGGSSPIAHFGLRVKPYEASTTYPLALRIAISDQPAAKQREMYRDLLSYFVRRAVCGLPTKNYNPFFMGALKHISNDGAMSPASMREHLVSAKATPIVGQATMSFGQH